MTAETAIIDVADVEKTFASVTAVDRVSFSVRPHEIFALLGPNGAGKTTLIRMLLGLIRQDAGRIEYRLDGRPQRVPPAAAIGYLPEDRGLYQDVEVLRTLVYFGTLRGMTHGAARDSAETWLERLQLADRRREPLKALSKGNQQKVQFISAVLHDPRIVILDEPFSGLDPLNQDVFLELIRELRDRGATVLLSAHQMQLVERVADHVMVVSRGRTVLNGTIPDIRRRWTTGSRLLMRVRGEPDLTFAERHEPDASARITADGVVELFVREGYPLGPLLVDAGAHLDIEEIETRAVTLHDVYVSSIAADDQARGGADVTAEG